MNPAEKLLAQFEAWKQPAPPQRARGLEKDMQAALMQHVEAMAHLAAITRAVDEMEARGRRVGRYREIIPDWAAVIMSYPQGWQSGNGASLITREVTSLLEGMSEDLGGSWPALTDSQRAALTKTLDGIVDLLGKDDALPEDLRAYLHKLLQHARDCVEDFDAIGRFELREALEHLWFALRTAEHESTGKKAEWASKREDLWVAIKAGVIAGVPGNILTAVGMIATAKGGS